MGPRQSDQAMMWAGWMRRWASFITMRRISWTDQRIRNMAWRARSAHRFFERQGISVVTDDGHHGEGEHDQ